MKRVLATMVFILLAGPLRAEVVTETIQYHHGERDLLAYVAYDAALEGQRPGVLMLYEWTGPRPFMLQQAERLARNGYVTVVSNIYSEKDGGVQAAENFTRNRTILRERAAAALALLQRRPQADPAQLAVVGFGFGGNTAFDLTAYGAPVAGVVSVHGVLDAKMLGRTPRCRVLALQGSVDRKAAPQQVQDFAQSMAGGDWQLVLYGGAGEAFANPEAASYNAALERRAWSAMGLFFSELFGRE